MQEDKVYLYGVLYRFQLMTVANSQRR